MPHHQALEKNQQWLTYDQQREAYVQSVVARTQELEQQLAQAKQQQTQQEATSNGELKGLQKLIKMVVECFSVIEHRMCNREGCFFVFFSNKSAV